MAKLDFNADDYEPLAPLGVIPAGNYVAIATSSEFRDTKSGDARYLQIEWKIVEGQYSQRRLWCRLNLDNPNQAAVDIAQRELSSICRAAGKVRIKDSAELHGIPLTLVVTTSKRADNGELANEIKGYKSDGPAAAPKKAASSKDPEAPPWA